jgi:flagellar export protein FliJ
VSRFRFGLEPVRRLREHAEQVAKDDLARELAEAQRRADDASVADARLAAAHAAALGDGSVVPAHELAARRAFVERLERERHVALARVDEQANEVARSRAGLEQAAREHETLQRAKSRARRAHALETARVEAEALDELATIRHGRGDLNSPVVRPTTSAR